MSFSFSPPPVAWAGGGVADCSREGVTQVLWRRADSSSHRRKLYLQGHLTLTAVVHLFSRSSLPSSGGLANLTTFPDALGHSSRPMQEVTDKAMEWNFQNSNSTLTNTWH